MDQITKINLNEGTPVGPQQTAPEVKTTMSLESKSPKKILIILLTIATVSGLTTGFIFAKKLLLLAGITPGQELAQNPDDANSVKVGQVFGSADEKTFRDPAEGIIQPGGIAGEGSHHLVRGDNESQWVYLTSSVVDLDNFVGHKVSAWGETIQGKKAGWLMDVGRLKVLELNAAEINAIEPAE